MFLIFTNVYVNRKKTKFVIFINFVNMTSSSLEIMSINFMINLDCD